MVVQQAGDIELCWFLKVQHGLVVWFFWWPTLWCQEPLDRRFSILGRLPRKYHSVCGTWTRVMCLCIFPACRLLLLFYYARQKGQRERARVLNEHLIVVSDQNTRSWHINDVDAALCFFHLTSSGKKLTAPPPPSLDLSSLNTFLNWAPCRLVYLLPNHGELLCFAILTIVKFCCTSLKIALILVQRPKLWRLTQPSSTWAVCPRAFPSYTLRYGHHSVPLCVDEIVSTLL